MRDFICSQHCLVLIMKAGLHWEGINGKENLPFGRDDLELEHNGGLFVTFFLCHCGSLYSVNQYFDMDSI